MFAKAPTELDLRKAQSLINKGEIAEACNVYNSVFQNFSKQAKALQQSVLNTNQIEGKHLIKTPPQEVVHELIHLYKNSQFSVVVEQAQVLTNQYPETFIFWNILGATAAQIGMADQAIVAFKKVISMKPDYPDAYSNISVAFKEQGKLHEAVKACKKAISLNPSYATAYSNLGNALKDQGKFEEALESYNKSISLKPDFADAYYNMGNALKDKGELDSAIDAYKKAISLKFDNYLFHNNMGNACFASGKLDEAIDAFKKSISINPKFAETHLNLGYLFIAYGKVHKGLQEYEWRWKTKKGLSRYRHFPKPQWDGQVSLKDKTILLWCEQGIGDTMNWSSCLSLVCARGAHVILECQEKLVPLLSRSFPTIEVKAQDRSKDADRDDFDFHLPMGSLYKHFIDEMKDKGNPESYLVPDPVRVQYWKDRLQSVGKGPYIGVSWKSSKMSPGRLPNYPSILEWSPIFKIPDVTFINLQYTDYADDIAKIEDEFGVKIHNFDDIDHFNDIDEVAALTAALDVVVSTKITVPFISAGVGTSTKLANWKQSPWNNIFLNPKGPYLDIFERNTWDPWDAVFKLIADDILKLKNETS